MHILPLAWWDEIVGNNTRSYLYNEQSPADMNTMLDEMLTDHSYQPPPISDFVEVGPDKISHSIYDTCIQHILHSIPEYKSRSHNVISIRMHASGVAFIKLTLYVHKPSCAFGRVVDIELFHTTSEDTHVVLIKLKGLISEDDLEFQSRSIDMSSLSASASPWPSWSASIRS